MNKELKNENKYVYTKEEAYILTNELIRQYKEDNLTKADKNAIMLEIMEVGKPFASYNCVKFKTTNNFTEITLEEALHVANSIALSYAINKYDTTKGVHFLRFWQMITERALFNEMDKYNAQKEKNRRTLETSIDVNRGASGDEETSLHNLLQDEASEEKWCFEMAFKKALEDFMAIDEWGLLIKYELVGTPAIQTRLRLSLFSEKIGSKEYGSKERSIVFRTKNRFKKFLLANDNKYGICEMFVN